MGDTLLGYPDGGEFDPPLLAYITESGHERLGPATHTEWCTELRTAGRVVFCTHPFVAGAAVRIINSDYEDDGTYLCRLSDTPTGADFWVQSQYLDVFNPFAVTDDEIAAAMRSISNALTDRNSP